VGKGGDINRLTVGGGARVDEMGDERARQRRLKVEREKDQSGVLLKERNYKGGTFGQIAVKRDVSLGVEKAITWIV